MRVFFFMVYLPVHASGIFLRSSPITRRDDIQSKPNSYYKYYKTALSCTETPERSALTSLHPFRAASYRGGGVFLRHLPSRCRNDLTWAEKLYVTSYGKNSCSTSCISGISSKYSRQA